MQKILVRGAAVGIVSTMFLAGAAMTFASPVPPQVTKVVTSADLDPNANGGPVSPATIVTDGLNKWFFYNDTNDTVDNTLGTFVTGPGTPPHGTGSAQMTLSASSFDRKNIATYQFGGTMLSTVTSLSYTAYSTSGVAGPNESPFLAFNIDFTGSNTWQRRLVYVPADNGSVPQDTWNTFNLINGGNALWEYSGAHWPAGATSDGSLLGTTARTWSAILADYPQARILTGDSWLGIRVGEPGPSGYTGSVDSFTIATSTVVTTYDFEPLAPTPAAMCPEGTTQGDKLETVVVNSNSSSPVMTLNNLASGMSYILKASGTWQNTNLNAADAEYASVDNWSTHMDGYNITPYFLGASEFDLEVDNGFVDWGAYSPTHEYSYAYTGTGAPASFLIFDGDSNQGPSATNAGWYGDNSGSLSVDVYPCLPPPKVVIAKYVDGAHATAQNANSAVFPMITSWVSSGVNGTQNNVPFTLSPQPWGGIGDPYEATYINGQVGDNYTTNEVTTGNDVVSGTCNDGDPFALVGYTTGNSWSEAQGATPTLSVPAFTNLQSDKYVIVWNKTCPTGPVPPPTNACATPDQAPQGWTLRNGTTKSDLVILAPYTMFVGHGGNDTVVAGDGNYIVCTGSGNDTVKVGNGTSVIDTGAGNDTVKTGDGDMWVSTGNGNDSVTTGSGNDTVDLGSGNNAASTGAGDDTITAGNGNDAVNAGAGTDTCNLGGGHNAKSGCEL